MGTFVEVSPLEYTGEGASELTTKTYHGLEIIVNNNVVGRISSYAPPQHARTVSYVRELSPKAFGRPVETVPGISEDGGYSLTVNRTEIWENEMEIAFGFSAVFIDLADQTRPFILQETLFKGNSPHQQWVYTGCWFSALGVQEYSADGDAKVMVNSTIAFTSRTRTV